MTHHRAFFCFLYGVQLHSEESQQTCWIRFRSIFVTAILSHYGQYAARIGPDCIYWTCWIQLLTSGSVPFLCKTGLDPIWMAWSGFGQTHLVRKHTSVQESLGPVCGNWPATSFPLSNSVTFFHGWPGSQCENQPGSDLVLADCIRLSPTGSGPEKSWNAKMIQPVFDQYF